MTDETILSLFSSLLVIKFNYWVIIHAYRFVIVVKKNMSSPVHLMILSWTPWHCPRYVTKIIIIKSPHTIMWWWRLIVFAESARRRRHLFLLSLENPYSDYLQIFAVCILALGNLPGEFCLRFSVSSTKSKMATKILWRTLQLEPLHRFVSCLV